MKKHTLSIILTLIFGITVHSQSIIVNYQNIGDSATIANLVGNNCTEIFDIEYIGDPIAFGNFNSDSSSFQMDNGLILSSGDALDVMGPNDSQSTSTNTSGGSDQLLSSITTSTINDAARLNYSLNSNIDVYAIQFSFASEEYLEWTGSSYTDILGIFISGPNPFGADYVNQNFAFIPGTTIAVSINNINNSTNSSYYINNGTGASPNNEAIQFDGYTAILNASIPIVPGEDYSISIIIGDAGDSSYDSGVFFRANPNVPTPVNFHLEIESLYGNGIQLFEGYDANLKVIRNNGVPLNTSITTDLSFGGTAYQGVDFNILSNSLTIPANQNSISVPLFVYNDLITESPEELIIYSEIGCSDNYTEISVVIYDDYFFDSGIIEDSLFFCSIPSIINTYSNSSDSLVSYLWNTGDTTNYLDYYNTLTSTELYTITVTHPNGSQIIDSVYVLNSGGISISIYNLEDSCNFGSIDCEVTGGFSPYTYSWNSGETTEDLSLIPSGIYVVTITDNIGCNNSNSIVLNSNAPLSNSFLLESICTDTIGSIYSNVIDGNVPYTYEWSTGTSNSYLSMVNPGNYYLTVTDDYGCQIIDSVIGFTPAVFSPTLVYSTLGCSPWEAEIIITDGNAPYEIEWSSSLSDTNYFVTNQPGVYLVDASDSYGCVFNESFIFQIDTTVNFSFNFHGEIDYCGPIYNQISFEMVPPSGTYSYLWSNGSTQDTLVNLSQGNFFVTVTNSFGCEQTSQIYIDGPYPLDAEIISTNIYDCNNYANGEISVIPNGGLAPYYYQWSNANTTNSMSNLTAGLYEITVTDNCGNSVIVSDSLSYEPALFDYEINHSVQYCQSLGGAISITENNSLPFISWLINSSGDTIQSGASGYYTDLSFDTYTLYASDTFYCITDTFNLELIQPLTEFEVFASQNAVSCSGDPVTLIAEIQNQNINASYIIDVVPLSMDSTSGTPVNQLLDDIYTGPYPIGFNFNFFGETQSEFYVGSNGWISFDPLASPTYDPWVVAAIPNTDSTRPRNVIMAAYRDWHVGVSGEINYNTVGTYPNRKLIVSFVDVSLFSCTSVHGNFQIVLHEGSDVIDVNLMEVPTCLTWNSGYGISGIQNADGTIAYKLDSLNMTPWEAYNYTIKYSPENYQWYDSNSNFIGIGSTISVPINSPGYYYCEIFSCFNTIMDSVFIDVLNFNPAANLGPDTEMCFGDLLEINAGAGYSYLWNNSSTTNSISITQSGNYSITISDVNCSVVDDINIFIEEFSPIPQYDTTMCDSDTTLITFDNNYTYQWEDGSISNIVEIYTSGEYYVTMSSGTCTYADTVNLFTTIYPFSLLDNTTHLCGESGILDPGTADNFIWSNGYYGQQLYVYQPGTYTVTMSNNTCITIDSTIVEFVPDPEINLGYGASLCEGESLTLDAGNYSSFLWSTGSTNQTINISDEDLYWVSVTDIYNCSNVDTFILAVIYEVVSSFSFDEAFGTVEFFNQSLNAFHYEWNFGDGSMTSTETNPVHTYPNLLNNEFYTVSCVAINVCGSDTSEFELIIFDIEENKLDSEIGIYPNPTRNSVFIDYKIHTDLEINLYNTSGQLLKKSLSFSNEPLKIHEICLNSLPDGVYLIQILSKEEVLTYRIIKE